MSYFSANYSKIKYPISEWNNKWLRNAQLWAINAISSYFTIEDEDPAIIVMPTGSGKTAVINLCPFVLRSKRVLIISSSVAVRWQIFEDLSTLKTLKEMWVFSKNIIDPKIFEVKSPIKNETEWNNFKKFDIVIWIPNSINTWINSEIWFDSNLFDLILVDEAHHVPAFTWTNIIKSFKNAKKIYFTATPFRRDKKEIEWKMVYNYPISKAYEDKIFWNFKFCPVKLKKWIDPDIAIAKKTQEIFNEDKKAQKKHFIMVRVEWLQESKDIAEIYKKHASDLKLKRIDSSFTYKKIKDTIEELKDWEIHGIICVDMLGEWFDFPNLKIAAIHSPKKSLASTIQFIGRFARTNAQDIGEAKFIAVPNDIEIWKKKLYQEWAIWSDIFKDMSEWAIAEENEIKEILDTFETDKSNNLFWKQISLYNLCPYCHVKVYSCEDFNPKWDIKIKGHEIIYKSTSDSENTIVFIVKEKGKPKWMLSDKIVNVKHNLFIVHFCKSDKWNLLFLNSSIKTEIFYEDLVKIFAVGKYYKIPKKQIHKVLLDIEETKFFNIWMQNKSSNAGETYKIIAWDSAHNSINKSHGRIYSNWHVFWSWKTDNKKITVWYSSWSKVWSNSYEKLPNFIKWCKTLATKMLGEGVVKTNTWLDYLPIWEMISKLPLKICEISWNTEIFLNPPTIEIIKLSNNNKKNLQLIDFDIDIDFWKTNFNEIYITLKNDKVIIELKYDFVNHFTLIKSDYSYEVKEDNHTKCQLVDYLNENPPYFYLEDFAALIDHEYHKPPSTDDMLFDSNRIESCINWVTLWTNIQIEFYKNKNTKRKMKSIHESLELELKKLDPDILIYDHWTWEIADFILMNKKADKLEVELFHVKWSGWINPWNRVNDLYEVSMQALKSQVWLKNKKTFKEKIKNRFKIGSKYILQKNEDFEKILNSATLIEYQITIVQPGITASDVKDKMMGTLAAADEMIINCWHKRLRVIWS